MRNVIAMPLVSLVVVATATFVFPGASVDAGEVVASRAFIVLDDDQTAPRDECSDAEKIRGKLLAVGIEEDDAVVLSGKSCGHKKIKAAWAAFLKDCKPNDAVIVYFYGAFGNDERERWRYIPNDGSATDDSDWISTCELGEDLKKIPCRFCIVAMRRPESPVNTDGVICTRPLSGFKVGERAWRESDRVFSSFLLKGLSAGKDWDAIINEFEKERSEGFEDARLQK